MRCCILLLCFLLPACNGEEVKETNCSNATDDDGDGQVDCDDPDCQPTLACDDGDTDDTDDTDDTGDTDTDEPFEFTPVTVEGLPKLTGEEAGARAGFSVSGGTDVDGDGTPDLLVGAYQHDTELLQAGAAYLVLGHPGSGTTSLSESDALFYGDSENAYLGASVAFAGDLTEDGTPDLLIAGTRAKRRTAESGIVYVVSGATRGEANLADATKLRGEEDGDLAGSSIDGVGDFNGDGVADVLVGAEQNDTNGNESGRVYLVHGPISGSTINLEDANARIAGEASGDKVGRSVASVDLNGDGVSDLVAGAHRADPRDEDSGAAYLKYGSFSGASTFQLADARFEGTGKQHLAGQSVADGGDLNGDGLSDLLVGAPNEGTGGLEAGMVYVLYGSATEYEGEIPLWDADARLAGGSSYDWAGWSTDGAGDFDGDGQDDVAVGAFGFDHELTARGIVMVVLGPVSGTMDLERAAYVGYAGESASDGLGLVVSAAGDVDGDGLDDLWTGAQNEDTGGESAGAAHLLPGF